QRAGRVRRGQLRLDHAHAARREGDRVIEGRDVSQRYVCVEQRLRPEGTPVGAADIIAEEVSRRAPGDAARTAASARAGRSWTGTRAASALSHPDLRTRPPS